MKLIHVLIFFTLLSVIVLLFQEQFLSLVFWVIEQIGIYVPFLKPPIEFVVNHIIARDLIGLFCFMFMGRNPFIPIPLEPYMFLVLANTGNFLAVLFITTIAITCGACFCYFIGFVIGKRVIEFVFKEKVQKNKWFEKHTGIFAFVIALFPLPDILSIIFGVHRSNIKHFIIGTFLGTLVKFLLIMLLYSYFEAQVYSFFEPYLETLPFLKAFFGKH